MSFKSVGARNSGGLILIHNIIRYEGSIFLFKSQKVKTFRYITNYLCEILIENISGRSGFQKPEITSQYMKYYVTVSKMVETKIFGKARPSTPPKPTVFLSGCVS